MEDFFNFKSILLLEGVISYFHGQKIIFLKIFFTCRRQYKKVVLKYTFLVQNRLTVKILNLSVKERVSLYKNCI